MAKKPSISNLAARKACDAIVDLLDLTFPGKVRIYDGTQPADVETPVSTQNLLAELSLSQPAFGNAVDSGSDAVATANAITDDSSADQSGTATWFRCVDSNSNPVIDGSVGTSDADMIVDNAVISAGQTVQIISFKYHIRES